MTDYGDSADFSVVISTGRVGGIPSGDRLFLIAQKVKTIDMFLQAKTNSAGQTSFHSRTGEHDFQVKIYESLITAYVGAANNSLAFENILDFLRSLQDDGEPPAYLWVWNNVSGGYVACGRTPAGTKTDYMPGYVKMQDFDMEKGNYFLKQLIWDGDDVE